MSKTRFHFKDLYDSPSWKPNPNYRPAVKRLLKTFRVTHPGHCGGCKAFYAKGSEVAWVNDKMLRCRSCATKMFMGAKE